MSESTAYAMDEGEGTKQAQLNGPCVCVVLCYTVLNAGPDGLGGSHFGAGEYPPDSPRDQTPGQTCIVLKRAFQALKPAAPRCRGPLWLVHKEVRGHI